MVRLPPPRWLAPSLPRGISAGLRICALLAALAATSLDGETIAADQQGARDGADVARRVLRGQVRSDDDSAALLRRARVTVIGTTIPPVFTDQEGRFEILVPERSYTVRITKPGFAPAQVEGTDGPDPSSPVAVRLARGAAISGSVIDGAGGPVVGARLTVRRIRDATRDHVPITVTTRSDDLGEFRVGSLAAGRYEVAVDPSGDAPAVVDGTGGATRVVPAPRPGDADPDTDLPPTAVLIRTAEEANVTVVYDRRTAESRAAAAYVAGYDAGASQAAIGATAGALRPGSRIVFRRGTAVVAGRVIDPAGRGVAGAIVRLNPVSAGMAMTAASDSGGRYQFNGVVSGAYRLSADKRGFLDGEHGQQRAGQSGAVVTLRDRQRVDRIDIGLRRGASISGIVTDPDGEPIEGLAMHAWRLEYRNGRPVTEAAGAVRRTDDRGRYRLHSLPVGTYYVVAADDPSASENMATVSRAPKAFYPGTPTVAQATPVFVDIGVDAAGADMTFSAPSTVRVSGLAMDSGSNPLNRPVVLVGSSRSGFPAPAAQMAAMRGWTFEFPHVAPGEYILQAMQYWSDVPGVSAANEFSAQPITIGEMDVSGVNVHTTPGTTVTGRIVMERGGRPPAGGHWLTIRVADPDYEPAPVLPRPWTTVFNPDLSFRISGLLGPLRISSTPALAPTVWLKAATMGGVNIAEEPALFGRRDDTNTFIDVVLADDGAEVAGRVVNGRKERVDQYVVAAFPVATEHHYGGSRYIRIVRPDERGEFRTGMLPPGDYWLVAIEAFEDAAIQDPDVVRALIDGGRRMPLATGDRVTVELPLARWRR
jgi:protocatechuate 3,4-dioxygenase beta subunit